MPSFASFSFTYKKQTLTYDDLYRQIHENKNLLCLMRCDVHQNAVLNYTVTIFTKCDILTQRLVLFHVVWKKISFFKAYLKDVKSSWSFLSKDHCWHFRHLWYTSSLNTYLNVHHPCYLECSAFARLDIRQLHMLFWTSDISLKFT